MEEKKDEKKVKVNVQFNLPSLLNYLAIAAVVIGLLYAILSTVGMGDFASGSAKAGQFFWGLLWAVVGGAVLAGLGELVSRNK